MIGMVPITSVLALLAAAVLLVVLALGSRSRVTWRATRSFRCPLRDRNVTAELEEKTWDGKRVDVVSCTAFTPPTDVRCGKDCLTLKSLPPAVAETRVT